MCCNFAAKNRAKAGDLGVIKILQEAWRSHKSNEEIARAVAGALASICANGTDKGYK